MQNWPFIQMDALQDLNAATDQIHYAAQLLAVTGKHFVENKKDDSHTNMDWRVNAFFGQPLQEKPNFQVALKVEDLTLHVIKVNFSVSKINTSLINKSQEEAFVWLKATIGNELGLDTSDFNYDLHYEIPDHPLAHGASYEDRSVAFKHFKALRTMGDLVLREHTASFSPLPTIKTWPHHFDHGAFIPIASDENNKPIKAIGLGLAIHDKVVSEPYFYITHWSKDAETDYSNLPVLPSGACWNRKPWAGAILKLSEIAHCETPEIQKEAVDAFMKEGIKASLALIE